MINLDSIEIESGDVVIDCGANIGLVTEYFFRKGAEVYAFEPNIYAFDILNKKYETTPKVTCYQKAVSTSKSDKKMKLYLHEWSGINEIKYSTGCSLMSGKVNVNEKNYLLVDVVSLCDFIESLNKPVKVLKIDIEGSEIGLLNEMIDRNIAKDIPHIFAETHEKKIPSLREETEKLKRRIENNNLPNINLNWI
jgi:FkbM family methyltransferase